MKILIIITLLISFDASISQNDNHIQINENEVIIPRRYFTNLTVGAIEFFSISFGYQINNSFSLALKANIIATHVGLGLNTGWGLGITGSYYFDDDLLNSIKLSVTPLFYLSKKTNDNQFIKAVSYECTMNHENLVAHSFRFYYEIGAVICLFKDREALIAPSLKLGVLYNL